MDHARGVCRGKSVPYLRQDLARLRPLEVAGAGEVGIEVLSVEQLHRQPGHPGGVVDPRVHDLDDVVALDEVADPGLLLEEAEEPLLGDQLAVHHLQRAIGARGQLLGHVHGPHGPLPKWPDDPVAAPDHRPWLERAHVRHCSTLSQQFCGVEAGSQGLGTKPGSSMTYVSWVAGMPPEPTPQSLLNTTRVPLGLNVVCGWAK